jgi:aminopeptidase-like protein
MAFISKISGVSYSSISKIGTILKANVQKVGGKDKPPTCGSLTLSYGDSGGAACKNTKRTTHYYDKTNDILYTDSCGGTEATYGFYSDGKDYREYNADGLSAPIAKCGRSDRR